MTKQQNMAGTELVVDSIRILKGDGLTGAGAEHYTRQLADLEERVTVIGNNQSNITDISDDKTITSEEKQTLKKEVLIIDTEYPVIIASAADAEVTLYDEYKAYTDAYTALKSYLNTNIHVFDDMTSSTEITSRSQFNGYFESYYGARQKLQDIIAKGYALSLSGLTEQNAIPVAEISAPVIAVSESNEYTPSYITIKAKLKNGDEENIYKAIIRIFRNEGTEPVYESKELEHIVNYVIPADTTSLRVVMYNQLGDTIYDNEPIDFVYPNSGNTLHLSNKYQMFYNGSVSTARAEAIYFDTKVMGYKGTERRPVDVGKLPATEGLSYRISGDTIYISPTEEIESTGSVTFNAFIENTDIEDAIVYGIGEGEDAIIIGLPAGTSDAISMGEFDGKTEEVDFSYENIERSVLRENIRLETGKYLGYVTDYINLPKTARNGDYVLYAGQSAQGSIWQNGLTYVYNGIYWEIDSNTTHQMASLADMFGLMKDLEESATSPNAMAMLLIKNLVAANAYISNLYTQKAVVKNGGYIQSENYNATNKTGWKIEDNGNVHFNNGTFNGEVNATSGTFTGSIIANNFSMTVNPGEYISSEMYGRSIYGKEGSFIVLRERIEKITVCYSGFVDIDITYNVSGNSEDVFCYIVKNNNFMNPIWYNNTEGKRSIKNYKVECGDTFQVYGSNFSKTQDTGWIIEAKFKCNKDNPIINNVYTRHDVTSNLLQTV